MTISSLNPAAPADTAFVGDGAGEIRAVKSALTTVFPAVEAEITKPITYNQTTGNTGTQPNAADFSQLFTDVSELSITVGGIDTGIVPIGTVAMWSGTDTSQLNAKGWFLCDGTNSTPNLQNRFVLGWGTESIGATGGGTGALTGTLRTTGTFQVGNSTDKTISNSVTLTESNLPAHYHQLASSGKLGSGQNGSNVGPNFNIAYLTDSDNDREYELSGYDTAEPTLFKSSSYGNPSPTAIDVGIDATTFRHEHDVVLSGDVTPPYYVLAYIIYKGTA